MFAVAFELLTTLAIQLSTLLQKRLPTGCARIVEYNLRYFLGIFFFLFLGQ